MKMKVQLFMGKVVLLTATVALFTDIVWPTLSKTL